MLVMGTTEGVFVAEAGGSAQASNLTERDVKVLRHTGQRILAGTADGIYRSDDGGCTWQPSGLEAREVMEVMPAPSEPRVVYASATAPTTRATLKAKNSANLPAPRPR